MATSTRRQFLGKTLQAAYAAGFIGASRQFGLAQGTNVNEKHFEVTNVERTTVKLEYRPAPRRNMDRELPHWRYIELSEVTLKSGHTGIGETMLYYTWGVPSDDDVARVVGKNAVETMWDDSLGAGLQMALFDAVGRTAGVPVHALLGRKVHSTTPLSWWNIDTSAVDMASECQEAKKLGYMSYKTKGRPWFDIFEQVDGAAADLPADFKIDMDFNDTLRSEKRGRGILRKLSRYPQVDIFESPIPQSDVQGNKLIAQGTHVNIAMHYGNPEPRICVRSGCCDGFVVGGGATRTMSAGRFCGETEMPFWLQLVGAGQTAAYSLHFGGALNMAKWPAVNCHQLFEEDLLSEKILLSDGHAEVPDRPGIGYEPNRDLIEKLKVSKPKSRPEPERLIETTWSNGHRMYTANNGKVNFMLTAANEDKYPYYEEGADTKLVPNDGTPKWRELYAKARAGGPVEG